MKITKLYFVLILIINLGGAPLFGQNAIRDSLIDESLKDFFSFHEQILKNLNGSEEYMIDMHTFPNDYDISKWTAERKIGIADFDNKKILKRYKKTTNGIPTICFKWKINQDGSLSFYIALYYVKIKRNIINYALSEVCVYCYKYSDLEKGWETTSKSHNGV